MRYVNFATVALLGFSALQALAQVPSGANPATGARPGHEIGVGDSLPLFAPNLATSLDRLNNRLSFAPLW